MLVSLPKLPHTLQKTQVIKTKQVNYPLFCLIVYYSPPRGLKGTECEVQQMKIFEPKRNRWNPGKCVVRNNYVYTPAEVSKVTIDNELLSGSFHSNK
jgi:hypothetical protein